MVNTARRLFAFAILIYSAMSFAITTPCLAEPADTASLLKTATSGAGDARYAAIDDLGERHEAADSVVPALAKLLEDEDPKIRWRSARSLGDYGEAAQPAAGGLRSALGDKDGVVQYHAAVALGKIGDRSDETIDALIPLITTQDGRVARAAIVALRNLKPDPKRVVAVLERAMSSNDAAVGSHAIEAAVERGAAAVPVLKEALKRPTTAYIACAAIEQIGPDAAGAIPELIELTKSSKHSRLLIQSLLALASIGPAAKSAGSDIVPLLEYSTDETVPVAAAYALGSIGAADADDALKQALSKPNPFLQMVAAWALARIHPDDAQLKQQAMTKLQAGLKSDDPAIQAAAEKGLASLEAPAEQAAAQ